MNVQYIQLQKYNPNSSHPDHQLSLYSVCSFSLYLNKRLEKSKNVA